MTLHHYLLAVLLSIVPFYANAQQLEILSMNCTFTSAGPEVEGTIKNLTTVPLSDIKVTSSFLDAKGNFINSGDSYIDYNPLLPGQTSTFSDYGDMNPVITQTTITLGVYEGPEFTFSGVGSATCLPPAADTN